jgi:hypothetical protein
VQIKKCKLAGSTEAKRKKQWHKIRTVNYLQYAKLQGDVVSVDMISNPEVHHKLTVKLYPGLHSIAHFHCQWYIV